MNKSIRRQYKNNSKRSLCKSKSQSKCNKIRGCKTAKGKKRTYCRKMKNLTYKARK